MQTVRRGSERGHFDHGWLDTYHTFSFSDYYDPDHMGFRALRAINEDRVAPGQGFGQHPHRDMEIVTCVLTGQLQHRDSLGNGAVIRPGEFQVMTAGTGILHSEFNPSPTEPVHLYQIWLLPERKSLPPRYDQRTFPVSGRENGWQRVASGSNRDGTLTIHQDAEILLTALAPGAIREYEFASGRHGWLQVLRGTVTANATDLKAGDGLALTDEPRLTLQAGAGPAELMLFDLA